MSEKSMLFLFTSEVKDLIDALLDEKRLDQFVEEAGWRRQPAPQTLREHFPQIETVQKLAELWIPAKG